MQLYLKKKYKAELIQQLNWHYQMQKKNLIKNYLMLLQQLRIFASTTTTSTTTTTTLAPTTTTSTSTTTTLASTTTTSTTTTIPKYAETYIGLDSDGNYQGVLLTEFKVNYQNISRDNFHNSDIF